MKLIIIVAMTLLASCSRQSLNDYRNEEPKLNLKEFFNGKLYAQGIVQDRAGKVIKRFKVDIVASWKDENGTMKEEFLYSDNSKSYRTWNLKEISLQKFEASAHDVVGLAQGEVLGNTFYFQYVLRVPVDKDIYEVHFDDWMYLLDKKTLLAKSKMTKWGFQVGEVTLVMIKEN